MSGPLIEVTGEFARDPSLYVRDHNTFTRNANRRALEFHHDEHIPRHFEPFAAAKYGYAPRLSRLRKNLTYQELKNQLGLPPLVSPTQTGGTTRDFVTQMRQITATRKRARLIMRLPFKGGTGRFRNLKSPTYKQLNAQQQAAMRRAEITAITPDEQRKLLEVHRDDYVRQANAPGVTRRKNYKTG